MWKCWKGKRRGHDATVTYRRGFPRKTSLAVRKIQNGVLSPDFKRPQMLAMTALHNQTGEKSLVYPNGAQQTNQPAQRKQTRTAATASLRVLQLLEKGERDGDDPSRFVIRTISLRHSRRHLSTKSNDGAPGFGTKNCVSLNIIVILMLHNPARRRRAVDDSTDEDRRLRAIRVDQQSEICLLSCVCIPPILSVPSVRLIPAALQTCRRHPIQPSVSYFQLLIVHPESFVV